MRHTATTVVALLLSIGASSAPHATTWHVKADGTGDRPTIRSAVLAASTGDTILLAPGTYTGNGNWNVWIGNKSLRIRSEAGPQATIIDCQSTGYGLVRWLGTLPAADTMLVSGITVENAVDTLTAALSGIAISSSIFPYDSLVVAENNIVSNCTGGLLVTTQGARGIVRDNQVTGCGNGISVNGDNFTSQTTFEITDNVSSGNSSTGLYCYYTGGIIVGNLIEGNVSPTTTGGIEIQTASQNKLEVATNIVRGNTGSVNSAGITVIQTNGSGKVDLRYNLVVENMESGAVAGGILALTSVTDTLVIENNTVSGNSAGTGAGAVTLVGPALVANNIVAFNPQGPGLICAGASPTLVCNNVFGNAGGDAICGIDGGGNFSADPLFCDAGAGDFSLSSYSPCLAGACGQVGALGRGCFDPRPLIKCVSDVGNDQGRQVRLCWERSVYDAPGGGTVVTGYAIYRRQDAFLQYQSQASPRSAAPERSVALAGWDYLVSVPARGDSLYQAVVPTLCDSTIADGDCWSVFLVSATTPDPFTYFDSAPDSGYSIDNLAPSAPSMFAVQYNAPGGTQLSWDESGAPDVNYYNIYRDTGPGLVASSQTPVHSTTETEWLDPIPGGWQYAYAVSAVDFAGNEGPVATTSTATGTGDSPAPDSYRLYQNLPNPFNPVTSIRFDVPSGGGHVSLRIYDVRGSLVRTLVDHVETGGRKAVRWNGRNGSGHPVATGVYFYELVAPGFRETRRMVLIK